jgi:hypothetical protein
MTWSEHIIDFQLSLQAHPPLPSGISMLQPFADRSNISHFTDFYRKFYDDARPRVFLIGINPGRFGAGVTGIPFTDPIRLEEVCRIPNDFEKRAELSSKFIYEVVDRFGGPEEFFSQVYITSTCPVGFLKNGKNFNYYDDKSILETWESYLVDNLLKQQKFGPHAQLAFSLGKGKNFSILQKLNKKYRLFARIDHLPHPRWVMQYRLKMKDDFIDAYYKGIFGAISGMERFA